MLRKSATNGSVSTARHHNRAVGSTILLITRSRLPRGFPELVTKLFNRVVLLELSLPSATLASTDSTWHFFHSSRCSAWRGVSHVTRRVLFDCLAFARQSHEAIVMAGCQTQSVVVGRLAILRQQRRDR